MLLDTGNEILFFEKISFELPYQLIRFEDRDQLKEYLMRCYDVDTTGECASPFILENDRVLEYYKRNFNTLNEKSACQSEKKRISCLINTESKTRRGLAWKNVFQVTQVYWH